MIGCLPFKVNTTSKISLNWNIHLDTLPLLFIYFWHAYGLSLVAKSRSYSLAVVHRRLIAVASLVAEHRFQSQGLRQSQHRGSWTSERVGSVAAARGLGASLSSCGAQAQLLCGLCSLLRPKIEPVSPELAGRFLSTVPLGKNLLMYLYCYKKKKKNKKN